MEEKQERLTIGVLLTGITESHMMAICKGIGQMAETLDINVVVFPGKYIDRNIEDDEDLKYEYQYNTVFEFAKSQQIRAIIAVAGNIGRFTSMQRLKELLMEYASIPMVLITSGVEGYVDVTYDNECGIREGLNYLVEKAGCHKIGMMGGPLTMFDAMQRRRVFLEVLKEHNLPFEESQYIDGTFDRENNREAAELLDRNPDLDAVFCANDVMAAALYEEMYKRGLVPGRDISVLGYDDSSIAVQLTPPLSTIKADPVELGNAAVKVAVNMVYGNDVSDVAFPSRFVLRESICGQKTETVHKESEHAVAYFHKIFFRFRNREHSDKIMRLQEPFIQLIDLLDTITDHEGCSKEAHRLLGELIQDLVDADIFRYADTDNMLYIFDKVFHNLLERSSSIEKTLELEQINVLLHKKLLVMVNKRMNADKQHYQEHEEQLKHFMQECFNGNYMHMIKELDFLQVTHACLYTFKGPVRHLEGEHLEIPKTLYLQACMNQGRMEDIQENTELCDKDTLLQNKWIHHDRRKFQVVLPLYAAEFVYGILLCDLADTIFTDGDFLVDQ